MGSLHRAARLGDVDEVAALLAQGVDVNAVGVRGFTPLLNAAQEGHLPIVRLLLEAGADVTLPHTNGRTPLHFAAGQGHLPVVQELVARGAPVNALSKNGATAALDAAQVNRAAVATFLLNRGTDAEVRDRFGLTAPQWLEKGGIMGGSSNLRAEYEASINTPERRARVQEKTRQLMAEGLAAEEWAAKHGRNIYVWGYGSDEYDDPDVKAWVARVTEVIFSPELLHECEERHLHGAELEEARRVRARREKRAARRERAADED